MKIKQNCDGIIFKSEYVKFVISNTVWSYSSVSVSNTQPVLKVDECSFGFRFFSINADQEEQADNFRDHVSMELKRSTDPLTLLDCFSAFTDRLIEPNVAYFIF